MDKATELKNTFNKLKQEYNLNISFEFLNNNLFLTDIVQKDGFVSEFLLEHILKFFIEKERSWLSMLHEFILPNPNSIISLTHSSVFNDTEKEEIKSYFKKIMIFDTNATKALYLQDKKAIAELINSFPELNEFIRPKIIDFLTRLNNEWKK